MSGESRGEREDDDKLGLIRENDRVEQLLDADNDEDDDDDNDSDNDDNGDDKLIFGYMREDICCDNDGVLEKYINCPPVAVAVAVAFV